jgi:nicotinate-nucleotide adenylyltransferase
MTRLAIAGEPGLAVSLADAPTSSGAPNYTLETLLKVRAGLPADGVLFCLLGADSFFSLRHWHRSAEIPFAAQLIVASRPGWQLDELRAALPAGLTIEAAPGAEATCPDVELRSYLLHNSAGESAPFYLLPKLNVQISASEIREHVRAAIEAPKTGSELLPKAVFDYIRSHGLYR